MTVKELKEALSEYPDDMRVVNLIDFHEEIYYSVTYVHTNYLTPARGYANEELAEEFTQAYQGDDSKEYVVLN
jgi:hypothetical protein